jgi:hypothetical protein
MYQSFNSSPEASARSTYAAFATIMQKLQRSDNMSRCDPVLSPLRGPAHKLSAMSRSTLQDIQGYVSYRYGAQQKMTNEVKKPTGDKFVFHLRPDEMEEAKVDITDEVGTDLASPINDYQEYAPALMDTQHPVSVYSDNLEGDVDLEVNAEDDQARLILSLEVEADLITYICTVQDPDEEKVRSLRHIASPHQHDLVLQHADVAEVDIWDQDFELSDDDSVQEAICTPLTSPRSAPSTYISPSSSSVTIPPPTAIGEDFKLVEIPSGRRSRAGFHRVVQVDPPSSEANLDEADPELVVSTSSSQHAAFLPYADIEVDEIWRSLQHEKSRKYSIEHNGGYTHGDIDEVAGEDTTTDEFCDDDAKTPVSPSKLILANEEDTSTSPHTPSSVSPVSLNVDDTSAEATRKVRLARSHGGVSLAALIAAAGLDEGDPDSSSTSDTSSDSEDNGLDTSFGYIYSNTPVRASENGYSNQPPCLDPTFPGHSPCAGRKSLGFGRSRDAALQAVRRRVESQDYATGQSDWYREWMTAKYEASNSIVMFNGGSSLRYEVSAEEVHGCEVILEEEVKMSLKEELDAVCLSHRQAQYNANLMQIAEDYAIDTILEEEEDVSSVFEEIGGGDLEALHFLEDAAVAAEFVVGGDEIEEDLVEVNARFLYPLEALANTIPQDESSLFDWTVGVYVDPTPLPEEDEDTALDYLLSSLPVQMDDHDLEEAMSEGFGSEAMEVCSYLSSWDRTMLTASSSPRMSSKLRSFAHLFRRPSRPLHRALSLYAAHHSTTFLARVRPCAHLSSQRSPPSAPSRPRTA